MLRVETRTPSKESISSHRFNCLDIYFDGMTGRSPILYEFFIGMMLL